MTLAALTRAPQCPADDFLPEQNVLWTQALNHSRAIEINVTVKTNSFNYKDKIPVPLTHIIILYYGTVNAYREMSVTMCIVCHFIYLICFCLGILNLP